jgi:hypothetical protein
MKSPTNLEIQILLKLWDDYNTALYHQINDPQPPPTPEPLGRISRFIRPTDLGKLA